MVTAACVQFNRTCAELRFKRDFGRNLCDRRNPIRELHGGACDKCRLGNYGLVTGKKGMEKRGVRSAVPIPIRRCGGLHRKRTRTVIIKN